MKYLTKKEFKKKFKRLKILLRSIHKSQKNIIDCLNTFTTFRATSLKDINYKNESIKVNDSGTNLVSTKEKRRKYHNSKDSGSLEDIKSFFHGKGYEIKDDGKKPIKIYNKHGEKVYVILRNKIIQKRIKETNEYKRVNLEDLL